MVRLVAVAKDIRVGISVDLARVCTADSVEWSAHVPL